MNYSLCRILEMILTLLLIRVISFAVAVPNNFDNLWRPSHFNSFSTLITVILVLFAAYVLYIFTKELGKSNDNRIKTNYFIYTGISYLFLSLFHRTILNFPYSYLYLLQNTEVNISAISPSLILDLFFEPPYIFWCLTFMGIVFALCKKNNHIEYAVPLWLIPIAFIFCPYNDAICTMHFCGCIIAFLGFRFSKGNSSLLVYSLQFLAYTGFCIYSKLTYCANTPFLNVALETIALFFLPGFIILWKCIKSKNKSAITATWLLPALTGFFITTPLLRLPSQYCLITLIATINSLLFTGNIAIAVSVIALFHTIISRKFPKTGKICSTLLFAGTVLFYTTDGILFYYSQMRPNYQTLCWTMTMNDIGNTTLATCAEYLTPTSITIIILALAAIVFTATKGYKTIKKKPGLATSLLILIVASQFNIMLMQLSATIPQAMRDPFFEMLKSFPEPEFLSKSMSHEEIIQGFKECKIPLQEFTENAPQAGNRTNVVLITLESLHWRYLDMFGNATQTFPLMSKLKNRMEIFPFMFSCYPESTCGDHALISSLVPYDHLFLTRRNSIMHKTLVNELKKTGYNTSMFSSESVNDGNLINLTKTLPFDYFFHYNSSIIEYKEHSWSWGYKEEFTAKKIIEYLKSKPAEQPFFVWYRTVYPHSPFPVFDKKESLVFKSQNLEPGQKDLITQYKNALIYLDRVLYDFVAQIDELDKKNNQRTIIFMVGDHGEMLGEKDNHNLNGHGVFVSPQLTAVAAILIKPEEKGFEVNQNVCSQIDVAPTILDHLNLKPAVGRYCQGNSLCNEISIARPVYLSSSSAYALVEKGYYFEFQEKETNNANVYRLVLTKDFKPAFLPEENWDKEDLNVRLEKTKKFFKLQQQLLNKL